MELPIDQCQSKHKYLYNDEELAYRKREARLLFNARRQGLVRIEKINCVVVDDKIKVSRLKHPITYAAKTIDEESQGEKFNVVETTIVVDEIIKDTPSNNRRKKYSGEFTGRYSTTRLRTKKSDKRLNEKQKQQQIQY